VVMVDQWGADESAERNRFGETRRLRQLLAPVTARQGRDPQPIRIRHVKFDQIDRELLKDARLVVIAGVRSPEPGANVSLLREYVEQGGSLILAAGGDFDPAEWDRIAWQDGQGILPLPLKPEAVGALPTETAKRLQPFQLDVSSLEHECFTLEQTPREECEALYRLPFFFKAVEADVSPATIERMTNNSADAPEKPLPRVLARFTNQVPFLVERDVGQGHMLFLATGIFREWNTLTSTDAIVLLDRMVRRLLEQTLPPRNLASTGQMVLPVASELRSARLGLIDPAGHEAPAAVDALGGDRYGVTIGNLDQRGVWRLVGRASPDDGSQGGDAKVLDVPLAAAGPAEESELRCLDEAGLRERLSDSEFRWVGPDDSIRIAPGPVGARDFWKWLMSAVLVGLFVESAILAWPLARREQGP